MTPGQMKDLISAVTEGIPSDLSFEVAQRLIGKKKKLTKKVKEIFFSTESSDYSGLVAQQETFYKKVFGRDCNFSNVSIPEKPIVGEWRLLILVDLTLEQLYAKCNELFPCWRWTNRCLDNEVVKNERDAKNGAYAIWVKDEVEADEELKNLSANDIKGKNITTETLAERLIHELEYFDETGNHLDIKNITLCAGSRYGDGGVPYVDWGDDEVRVDWFVAGHAGGRLRSRQVVS
jgi:hypothetical protein